MPANRPGEAYQVWLQRGGGVVPSSLFHVYSRDGRGAAAIPESLEGVKAVLVTRERAGGAARPSEAPVIRVDT